MKELTNKQAEVYNYLKEFSTENNYQPSYQEIADYLKIHRQSVQFRFDALEKKGYIQRTGKSRAIRILK